MSERNDLLSSAFEDWRSSRLYHQHTQPSLWHQTIESDQTRLMVNLESLLSSLSVIREQQIEKALGDVGHLAEENLLLLHIIARLCSFFLQVHTGNLLVDKGFLDGFAEIAP